MTKAELIEKIASIAGFSKTDAGKALDATMDAVKFALKKGQKVTLVGFGTFSVSKRKARKEPVTPMPSNRNVAFKSINLNVLNCPPPPIADAIHLVQRQHS